MKPTSISAARTYWGCWITRAQRVSFHPQTKQTSTVFAKGSTQTRLTLPLYEVQLK